MLCSKNLTWWPWPWKSIGFQILLRTRYVPSLVKIHWRMLILECSQGCYVVKIWPWKSIGFQILLRTKYVPSLVKIQWRMLILECSQGCYGRTDGSITISLRNFVDEGIINHSLTYSNIISFCEKLLNAYFLIQSVMTWKKCNAQIMCTGTSQ